MAANFHGVGWVGRLLLQLVQFVDASIHVVLDGDGGAANTHTVVFGSALLLARFENVGGVLAEERGVLQNGVYLLFECVLLSLKLVQNVLVLLKI